MKQLNALFTKHMTRKEFLVYAGLILLTISGVSGLFKSLQDLVEGSNAENGYGSRAYGA